MSEKEARGSYFDDSDITFETLKTRIKQIGLSSIVKPLFVSEDVWQKKLREYSRSCRLRGLRPNGLELITGYRLTPRLESAPGSSECCRPSPLPVSPTQTDSGPVLQPAAGPSAPFPAVPSPITGIPPQSMLPAPLSKEVKQENRRTRRRKRNYSSKKRKRQEKKGARIEEASESGSNDGRDDGEVETEGDFGPH